MNGTMNLPHFIRTRARPRSIRQSAARAWWLALGLVCASPSAFAYDLWQAYQDAQVNDPTYLSDIAQKEVYDAQKKQARAAMMPTVLVGAGIYKTRKQFWQSPLPDIRTTDKTGKKRHGDAAIGCAMAVAATRMDAHEYAYEAVRVENNTDIARPVRVTAGFGRQKGIW